MPTDKTHRRYASRAGPDGAADEVTRLQHFDPLEPRTLEPLADGGSVLGIVELGREPVERVEQRPLELLPVVERQRPDVIRDGHDSLRVDRRPPAAYRRPSSAAAIAAPMPEAERTSVVCSFAS